MSYYGSIRETIFTLYLKLNLHILEEVLNIRLSKVEIEKQKYYRAGNFLKLDMYCTEINSNVEVFVENIVKKSDGEHQKRLLNLIGKIDEGIVVYMATSFRDEDILGLREAVQGKNISLYFIRINKEIVELINILNTNIHKLNIYNNLNILDTITNPLELLSNISIIKPIIGKRIIHEQILCDLTNKLEINEYLLTQLQSKIPYFIPFHNRKSRMDSKWILTFGMGKSDISLRITTKSRGKAFVELEFRNSFEIYNTIKEKEQRAKQVIGEELKFIDDRHTISYRFNPYSSTVETVNKLVNIAEKFVQAFCNYTYYYGEPEMWEKFEYSL